MAGSRQDTDTSQGTASTGAQTDPSTVTPAPPAASSVSAAPVNPDPAPNVDAAAQTGQSTPTTPAPQAAQSATPTPPANPNPAVNNNAQQQLEANKRIGEMERWNRLQRAWAFTQGKEHWVFVEDPKEFLEMKAKEAEENSKLAEANKDGGQIAAMGMVGMRLPGEDGLYQVMFSKEGGADYQARKVYMNVKRQQDGSYKVERVPGFKNKEAEFTYYKLLGLNCVNLGMPEQNQQNPQQRIYSNLLAANVIKAMRLAHDKELSVNIKTELADYLRHHEPQKWVEINRWQKQLQKDQLQRDMLLKTDTHLGAHSVNRYIDRIDGKNERDDNKKRLATRFGLEAELKRLMDEQASSPRNGKTAEELKELDRSIAEEQKKLQEKLKDPAEQDKLKEQYKNTIVSDNGNTKPDGEIVQDIERELNQLNAELENLHSAGVEMKEIHDAFDGLLRKNEKVIEPDGKEREVLGSDVVSGEELANRLSQPPQIKEMRTRFESLKDALFRKSEEIKASPAKAVELLEARYLKMDENVSALLNAKKDRRDDILLKLDVLAALDKDNNNDKNKPKIEALRERVAKDETADNLVKERQKDAPSDPKQPLKKISDMVERARAYAKLAPDNPNARRP